MGAYVKMNSKSVALNVLVDAKTEYTKQLVDMLTPRIYEGITSLYEDTTRDSEPTKILVTFQQQLSQIPNWTSDILEREYQRIQNKSDCDWIEDLVTVMGERSLLYLYANKSYVSDLGRKTRSVSSTQFLGYVFEHPELVKSMRKIARSSIKWKRFTKGIIRGLEKEALASLNDEIPSFADHTGSDKDKLFRLAKKRRLERIYFTVTEEEIGTF